MTRKQYISPSVDSYQTEQSLCLAASQMPPKEVVVDPEEDVNDSDKARRYNVWDDEE